MYVCMYVHGQYQGGSLGIISELIDEFLHVLQLHLLRLVLLLLN